MPASQPRVPVPRHVPARAVTGGRQGRAVTGTGFPYRMTLQPSPRWYAQLLKVFRFS